MAASFRDTRHLLELWNQQRQDKFIVGDPGQALDFAAALGYSLKRSQEVSAWMLRKTNPRKGIGPERFSSANPLSSPWPSSSLSGNKCWPPSTVTSPLGHPQTQGNPALFPPEISLPAQPSLVREDRPKVLPPAERSMFAGEAFFGNARCLWMRPSGADRAGSGLAWSSP
jgi:hypothetical protein